jgi:hypothetical protein
MRRRLLLLALAALTSIATIGCQRRDPADSSIPWGRPAAWEDRVPGMGDF